MKPKFMLSNAASNITMFEKSRPRRILSAIVMAVFSIVIMDHSQVLAETPSADIKKAIIEAKDILPTQKGERLVSLCPDISLSLAPRDTLDRVRSLAEKGNSVAQCGLGVAYHVGLNFASDRHLHPDAADAMIWFRKSADQGNPDAQSELGGMYEHGEGVKQDFVEASKWYRKAAEQGEGWAQFCLAEFYKQGAGVAQNDAEALRWYRRAAEQGMPLAMLFLSDAYRSGTHGLAVDHVQAYRWMIIRDRVSQPIWAGQRDATDKTYLAPYEQGMTAEQITEAKRLADTWKPEHEQPYQAESLNEFEAK